MFKNILFFLFVSVAVMLNAFAMDEENKDNKLTSLQSFPNFSFEESNQNDLNRWVALQGAQIYNYLNNSDNFDYPREGQYSTTSEHWKVFALYMAPMVHFIKKKDILASVALESLLANKGRFDCRIAQRIAFMECVRRLIGNDLFDHLAKQFEQEPSNDQFEQEPSNDVKHTDTKELFLDGNEALNPYFRLTSQEKGSLYKLGKVGFFGYVPNLKEYIELHPQGSLSGDNGLLCLSHDESTPSYIGYGDFYKTGPRSWDETRSRFQEETLTLSTPEEIIVDGSNIPENRRETYIKHTKMLYTLKVQRQKTLIESLKDTYEDKFTSLQIVFSEPAFFIDLEKVNFLLKN